VGLPQSLGSFALWEVGCVSLRQHGRYCPVGADALVAGGGAFGLGVWGQPEPATRARRAGPPAGGGPGRDWAAGGRLPHLHDALKPAQQYGRDLRKLLPQLAELERFLAKPSTEGPTRDRLLVRHHELMQGFTRGVAYLERLGAELVLVAGSQEPPALAELPQFLIELREVLHPSPLTRG